jgi:hypothetical protein
MSPKELYKNDLLVSLENTIAHFLGYQVWNEEPKRIIELLTKEMTLAYLDPDDILAYFSQNTEKVKCFSSLFLPVANPYEDPPLVGRGFLVSHTIFMIYLERRTLSEMKQYLKRRQLPKAREIIKDLEDIWGKCEQI